MKLSTCIWCKVEIEDSCTSCSGDSLEFFDDFEYQGMVFGKLMYRGFLREVSMGWKPDIRGISADRIILDELNDSI